jgi:anti-sigma B factor antagonist
VQPNELEVNEEQLGDGTRRLALKGELDMVSAPEVSARLEELAAESGVAVRLDLSELTFMDSTGVRVIYTASRTLQDNGGRLEIVRPTGEPWRALEITGLHRILPFTD